ncbi:hypothetical protein [Stenotrophomonas maltophilia]|uniref:hypothetical protein n=1 Tax=Stenotrophomonas maltophilia TaxID=40324 RepID=UPI0012AF07CD|nr:hypothetical protein [Stenotrophomonas maltophilia]QGM06082.1 hypothetical protein FEO88_14925 [Stenotrophomonas maltophilia]
MAIFCPLANDVGNLSDWVAIAIGLAGVIATATVAWFAHSTSSRAVRIAEEAKRIAEQQRQDALDIRSGTAEIVESLLTVELAVLPGKIGAVLTEMNKADRSDGLVVVEAKTLQWVLRELSQTFMPMAEKVQERLHNIDGDVGKEIAELIGFNQVISDLARRLDAKFPWSDVDPEVSLNPDGSSHFIVIRNEVKRMLGSSLDIAPRFARRTSSVPVNYKELDALANAVD